MQETQETWVWSLVWEDPMEEEMANHCSILPRDSYGQRSLPGYSPLGCKESDRTEVTEHMRIDALNPVLRVNCWFGANIHQQLYPLSFFKNSSHGFLDSRERLHDWTKQNISWIKIIPNSPCHTQFISCLQEGELHKEFIGSSITVCVCVCVCVCVTVFSTFSAVTAEAPGEVSAAFLSMGFLLIFSYPRI